MLIHISCSITALNWICTVVLFRINTLKCCHINRLGSRFAFCSALLKAGRVFFCVPSGLLIVGQSHSCPRQLRAYPCQPTASFPHFGSLSKPQATFNLFITNTSNSEKNTHKLKLDTLFLIEKTHYVIGGPNKSR